MRHDIYTNVSGRRLHAGTRPQIVSRLVQVKALAGAAKSTSCVTGSDISTRGRSYGPSSPSPAAS
jgi:hypothetical protein